MLLLLRSINGVGKGLRSAPREALVADATPPAMRGYAFGFNRALDNAGAVAGSLVAAAALAWAGMSLTEVMLWSAVPGVGGALLRGGGAHAERQDETVGVGAPVLVGAAVVVGGVVGGVTWVEKTFWYSLAAFGNRPEVSMNRLQLLSSLSK